MEPWLEVVVVAADSPELGSDSDTWAREGGAPARKRPRLSPPPTDPPMEWESLEPAELAAGATPALGGPPRRAPPSSQLQPAPRSVPGPSASCGPGRENPAHQRPKKPARSKRRKSMGNQGLAAFGPLVRGILSAFSSGLRLAKLLEILRSQHGVDVEVLSGAASGLDVLGLLAQVPGLRVCAPERGPQCLIQLERALADEFAPAPEGPPGLAPSSSQAQPAPRSAPACSASCGPGRGDPARQQLKRPARSKKAKSKGNRDAAVSLAPLLWDLLRPFPLGLGLPKLLEAVWRDHKLDLLVLSQEAGYRDVPGLLGQVPGIRLHRSKHSRCTVHLDAGGVDCCPSPSSTKSGWGVGPPPPAVCLAPSSGSRQASATPVSCVRGVRYGLSEEIRPGDHLVPSGLGLRESGVPLPQRLGAKPAGFSSKRFSLPSVLPNINL